MSDERRKDYSQLVDALVDIRKETIDARLEAKKISTPTAFSKAPVVYGDAAAIAIAVTTTTTTTLTSVGAVAGFIMIEGY
jgi:hypothetical protein